jgi:hypothetical protein
MRKCTSSWAVPVVSPGWKPSEGPVVMIIIILLLLLLLSLLLLSLLIIDFCWCHCPYIPVQAAPFQRGLELSSLGSPDGGGNDYHEG